MPMAGIAGHGEKANGFTRAVLKPRPKPLHGVNPKKPNKMAGN